ncbi:MAG: flagellar hook-length control protein FliK, partial [Myxococcaceae bacterium]
KASDGMANAGRADDKAGAGTRAEGRKGDAKVSRDRLDEKKESSDAKAAGGAKGGGALSEKGDLKAGADKGGGQGGSKDNSKGGEAAASPGFRFNPALMAPMPVAQASNTANAEKLRKLANEIAQKIVERVRVGTNAAGKSEFQIDLKDNVLSGLTVKVSSSGGKIKAVFSGRDPKILKMLGQQEEALKGLLEGRGLTLEEFKIEERA